MKTILRFLLLSLFAPGAVFAAESATLQSKPTATSPAGDDWTLLQGATNGQRKLAPSYYLSATLAATTYQPLDSDLTSIAALSTTSFGRSVLPLADAAAGRTLFGVVIGTDVQGYDADLAYLAGFTTTANVRSILNAADYAAVRGLLSLDNVTNTSDANKPVSTAQQTALDLKASLSAIAAVNASGVNTDGLIDWSQLVNMPAGFADGSDDGSGGGSGTVTSFSAGDLSPLFTTSEATATTTPALTFSLTNAAQNAVFAGPGSGGTGAPSYRALVAADIPSLSSVYQPLDDDLTYLAGFTPTANVKSILNAADYAAIRSLLTLVPGTDVQAYDADLAYLAGFTTTANVRSILNAADYAAIKALLSVENVTNTSDANKPVSTAQQTALDLKANLAGGNTFTGIQSFDSAETAVFTTMAADVIDVTKRNTKTISSAHTFSFSATPPADRFFPLKIVNSSGTDYTMTLPANVVPLGQSGTISGFVVPAGSTVIVWFSHDGTNFRISGNPALTSGSGAYALVTSPVFDTDITLPNSAAPTTGSVAKLAFDTNAWASGRGAAQLYDGTANTWVVATLASDTPTNGQVPTWNTGGTIDWQTPGGSGTVTATAGSLTANSVVLGAGTTDTKVVAGIITDGTSKLTLGVAGTSVGSVDFKNATSGTITLAPPTGALGTVTVTLPASTQTLATLAGTESLTNKKLGSLTSNGFVRTSGGDGTLSVSAAITPTIPIFNFATIPDSTGEAFFEPYTVVATNDNFKHMVLRLGSSNSAQPTVNHGVYGSFTVPADYSTGAGVVIKWNGTVTSGDVYYVFSYRVVAAGASLDQTTFQQASTVTATVAGTTNQLVSSTISPTAGNFTAGDVVEFYFQRDGTNGADTMAGSAIIHDVRFSYSTP